MESEELIRKILYNEIEEFKVEEEKLKRQLDKLLNNFDSKNIEKFTKISNEINQIKFTIVHLYSMIGGMDERIKKATK
jgi:hypothetical protein